MVRYLIFTFILLFSIHANASFFLFDGSVTTQKLADGAVTKIKLANPGIVKSVGCSDSVLDHSTSFTDIDDMNLEITVTGGRPVIITLQVGGGTIPVGGAAELRFTSTHSTGSADVAYLRLLRIDSNSSELAFPDMGYTSEWGTVPMGFPLWIDNVETAGTYTYKLQRKVKNAADGILCVGLSLIAQEL